MKKAWILLLAAVPACFPEKPPELSHSDVGAGIRYDCRTMDCMGRVKRGEGIAAPSEFDLAKMVCKRDKEELLLVTIHDPTVNYRPSGKYSEVAYYCPKEKLWYYHYSSADGAVDSYLGPFRLNRVALPESEVEQDRPPR